MQVQNFDRNSLPMVGFFQPYAAYICVIIFPIIIFFNGFSTMIGGFAAQDFIAAYIGVPIFFLPWIGMFCNPPVLSVRSCFSSLTCHRIQAHLQDQDGTIRDDGPHRKLSRGR